MLTRLLRRLVPRLGNTEPPNESSAPRKYFSWVYSQNAWGGACSKSGQGSEGDFAAQKVSILKEIIVGYGVSTILDLGCGDFFWMRDIAPQVERYHGVDIVSDLVNRNQRQYGGPRISFQCLDLSNPEEQPKLNFRDPDLVVCFDVFGHLLNKEVDALLKFILQDLNAQHLLATNRREPGSADYLQREKSRTEGIDLEQHSLFSKCRPERLRQFPALYPNDFFDLYKL